MAGYRSNMTSRIVVASLACLLALGGCASGNKAGEMSGSDGAFSEEQSGESSDVSSDDGLDAGDDAGDGGADAADAQENTGGGTSDAPSGDGGSGSYSYGPAPTKEYSSTDDVPAGDLKAVKDVPMPSGVDADLVKKELASALHDVKIPKDVEMSEVVDGKTIHTSEGDVTTKKWSYTFGEGDAILSVGVEYVEGGNGGPEVYVNSSDTRGKSLDVKDKASKTGLANTTDKEITHSGRNIESFAGGQVSTKAVKTDVYAVSVTFTASGKDLDREGTLPTLTVNGKTLKAMRVDGGGATGADGAETANFVYQGDITVTDSVTVGWCVEGQLGADKDGKRRDVSAYTYTLDGGSMDYAGGRCDFSRDPSRVMESVAKAIGGTVSLCRLQAANLRAGV